MTRTCLVLGGASCLQDDLDAYAGPIDGVVACNDAGTIYPGPLDAWVSLHARYFESKNWLAERERAGFEPARRLIGHHEAIPSIELHCPDLAKKIVAKHYCFPGHARSGSSGLFAAKVALVDLKFDIAVLCGIPLTATPHFFDPPSKPWNPAIQYRSEWMNVPKEWRDKMRSMSGWTSVLLGPPSNVKPQHQKGGTHAPIEEHHRR